MNRKLFSASGLALAVFAANAHGMSEEQYREFEARVDQLENGGMAPVSAAAAKSKFKVNGFLSAGFGFADIEDFRYDDGLYDQVSHTADSALGLQIEGTVNDEVNAVVQLVARGTEDFAVDAEWAYVGWRLNDANELRAGRLRSAYYMLSEYLEVGYTYPWARPPAEVYLAVFPSSFDGVSWLHRMEAGEWSHDFKVNWGSTSTADDNGSAVTSEDSVTLGVNSTRGNWQVGVQATTAKVTIENDLFTALNMLSLLDPIERDRADYVALGAQYDNGKLLVMVEATDTVTDSDALPDTRSGYATVGYRIGKFMPHVTYSGRQVSDDIDRDIPMLPFLCAGPGTLCLDPAGTMPFPSDTMARLSEQEQESVTLGLRYDFLPNAAIKADWTRVLDTHGTYGLFAHELSNLLVAPPDEEIDMFRVVVDVTF